MKMLLAVEEIKWCYISTTEAEKAVRNKRESSSQCLTLWKFLLKSPKDKKGAIVDIPIYIYSNCLHQHLQNL